MGRINVEYWRRHDKEGYGGLIDKYCILSGIDKGYRIFKGFSKIFCKDTIYNSIEEYYMYSKVNEYHPYRDKEE